MNHTFVELEEIVFFHLCDCVVVCDFSRSFQDHDQGICRGGMIGEQGMINGNQQHPDTILIYIDLLDSLVFFILDLIFEMKY